MWGCYIGFWNYGVKWYIFCFDCVNVCVIIIWYKVSCWVCWNNVYIGSDNGNVVVVSLLGIIRYSEFVGFVF